MNYNVTYRQKDGGWQYIISFKENGKWKQRSKQGFRTKALAKRA
ncbi:MAG TPA: Arm DNA-binding domain-containing protein, partial [Clostridia bacterium]|nr:Arm DNA-binding domain-containing protein [Clostridia bacterium]